MIIVFRHLFIGRSKTIGSYFLCCYFLRCLSASSSKVFFRNITWLEERKISRDDIIWERQIKKEIDRFFLKECLFKLYEQKININLDLNLFSYQNFLVSRRPTWNLSFSQSIWSLNFFSFPMRGLLYSFSKNKKKNPTGC